jgi:uncharacterized protein
MRRFASCIAFALALLLAPAGPAAPLAAQQTVKFSKSHLAAATELLAVMRADALVRASVENQFQLQSNADPALAAYDEVIDRFTDKYLSWNVLKDDLTRLYASAYTEAELRQLTAFFKSPLGQKTIRIADTLHDLSAVIGERYLSGHLDELQKMLDARARQLERERPGLRPVEAPQVQKPGEQEDPAQAAPEAPTKGGQPGRTQAPPGAATPEQKKPTEQDAPKQAETPDER